MQKLSNTQHEVLKAMIENPEVHPCETLGYIRNPQIRERVINSLVNNGWLIYDNSTDNYTLTNQTRNHYGLELRWDEPEEDTAETEIEELAEPKPEKDAAENAAPAEECGGAWVKKVKINKKRTLIMRLESGASMESLVAMTGWKKASVRGVMSTIQKESGRQILRYESDGEIKYRLENLENDRDQAYETNEVFG